MSNQMQQSYFYELADVLCSKLSSGEYLTINLAGEDTHYLRLNNAHIRQTGTVDDFDLDLKLIVDDGQGNFRQASKSFNLSLDRGVDEAAGKRILSDLQKEVRQLPVDPFAILPSSDSTSESVTEGTLLTPADAPDAILSNASGLDLTGIYSSGRLFRGNATSAGAKHWFATDSFLVDYSLYGAEERAYKGFYGGQSWDQSAFSTELERGREQLTALAKPVRKVEPGEYRTYLAPAAAWEFSGMLFHIFSESSIQQGDSPLRLVRQGKKSFSPLFSITDDFTTGASPRFSSDGELYPKTMSLVDNGTVKTTLISKRTAKEYGLESNRAGSSEAIQAPVIGSGSLKTADAVKELGTGLYISNLHYLNWSDRSQGRVTGMTRYACFWVENGELVAPIENLRWDDTIYRVFGSELEALTEETSMFPETSSYEKRGVGAVSTPGILLKSMAFTL